MNEKEIKALIPEYIEGALQPDVAQEVKTYLEGRPEELKEAELMKLAWDMLDLYEPIEPAPGYVSRFWTRVATRRGWLERFVENLKWGLTPARLTPVLVTACVVIVVSAVVLRVNDRRSAVLTEVAALPADDLEMIENIELAENLDLIEDLEFFEDLDVIEYLDTLDTLEA